MKRIYIILLSIFCALLAFSCTALAAPFTTKTSTPVLVAPAPNTAAVANITEGTIVDVTHQAGGYWRVETPDGKTGYVEAAALAQTQTKGIGIATIIVAAGAPIIKYVVTKAVGWFKKLLGVEAGSTAGTVINAGMELFVLDQLPGGWLKVKSADNKIGYIKKGQDVVPLQPVNYADNTANQYDWAFVGAKPIPATASGLTVQVEVRKTDGSPVIPGKTPLKLGDEYDIYITTSADAYVRVTAQTKGMGNICQYYPNHLPGTKQSAQFKAGYNYSSELLPSGVHYRVSEPIGTADMIRIEANTYAPYKYVDKPQGCVAMTKGPGFGNTTEYQNPTAQVVVEYEIVTVK